LANGVRFCGAHRDGFRRGPNGLEALRSNACSRRSACTVRWRSELTLEAGVLPSFGAGLSCFVCDDDCRRIEHGNGEGSPALTHWQNYVIVQLAIPHRLVWWRNYEAAPLNRCRSPSNAEKTVSRARCQSVRRYDPPDASRAGSQSESLVPPPPSQPAQVSPAPSPILR
jgi:hypothetical protein